MRILWKYLKPYKKELVVGPFFKLCEAILELLIPILMAFVIDKGVNDSNTGYIVKIGLVMFGVVIIGLLFAYVCQYSASIASQGFGTNVRNAVFQHISELSYSQIESYGTSSLVNRITNDINIMQQGVAMLIRLFIRAPFICLGSIVMSLFIDVKLALVFIVSLPIFIVLITVIMGITVPLYKKVQSKTDNIASALRENLAGVRVIRAFAKKDVQKEKFEDSNREYQKYVVKVGRISAIMNPATMLIMNIVIVLLIHFGSKRVFVGSMTQGEVTAFISYATYIINALVVLANLIVLLTKAVASSNRVAELLSIESNISEPLSPPKSVDTEFSLEFKNVSFAYNSEAEEAVSNIDFSVRKGQQIGVIGGTGAGKSTIANLIDRLYDATDGAVLVDGIDVKEYSQKELRGKIGFVTQKAVLFSGTVAENVRQGKPDATDSEIIEALKVAQAYDFVSEKQGGINTKVSRGGANFSGGQKQRLSIARALVRKPDILILDDSSSALDYATDASLRIAIRKFAKEMTVINISQRVSSLIHCDKILLLSQGQQIAFDNHYKLIDKEPLYQDICHSQLKEGVSDE